ncbi:unnamed protein product [marine sediment metagenome]|uniref:Uncharacterized protein n=1 Tax=marine sediment metagenome TaxID=412755 RepID=X1UU53_9ZZZZ
MVDYVDITTKQVETLRFARNTAGNYMANRQFDRAFECLLDIKRDLEVRKIHPKTFDNILEEVFAIGAELSGQSEMITIDFAAYIGKRLHAH